MDEFFQVAKTAVVGDVRNEKVARRRARRMGDRKLQPVVSFEISRTGPLDEALLALNNAHAQELSWLEPERLKHLPEEARFPPPLSASR